MSDEYKSGDWVRSDETDEVMRVDRIMADGRLEGRRAEDGQLVWADPCDVEPAKIPEGRSIPEPSRGIKADIEALADEMDLNAEGHNAHDFVITHRALAVLMVETIGAPATLKVFRAIQCESGDDGLPGLTGVAGMGPEKEFLARRGLSTNWAEWHLP